MLSGMISVGSSPMSFLQSGKQRAYLACRGNGRFWLVPGAPAVHDIAFFDFHHHKAQGRVDNDKVCLPDLGLVFLWAGGLPYAIIKGKVMVCGLIVEVVPPCWGLAPWSGSGLVFIPLWGEQNINPGFFRIDGEKHQRCRLLYPPGLSRGHGRGDQLS